MRVKFPVLSVLFVSVAAGLGLSAAEASTEKILLSRETVVDQETGERGHKLLNPSGEVRLTFTKLGLQLEFENQNRQVERIQIVIDFPAAPTDVENERQKIRNDLVEKTLQERGQIMAGQLIRNAAAAYVQKDQRLVLLLDTSRVTGFDKSQITMSQVKLTGPGEPPTALDRILFNMVAPSAEAYADQTIRSKSTANPVGFMWGLPRAEVGGPKPRLRTCDSLFGALQ